MRNDRDVLVGWLEARDTRQAEDYNLQASGVLRTVGDVSLRDLNRVTDGQCQGPLAFPFASGVHLRGGCGSVESREMKGETNAD